MVAGVELTYDINATAMAMAELIFGDRVTVVGASYTGDSRASGIYSDADTISPGVAPSDTGVILSTGQVEAFTTVGPQSNRIGSTTTPSSGPNRLPDFDALAGDRTFDAAVLDVDFVPDEGVEFITMSFVFASEEYPEFVNSQYNDLIGIWINGAPVGLGIGGDQAGVNNINVLSNPNLYIDNTGDAFNTEMDAFTVTMSVTIPVNPGVNSIRIGVADVADAAYDSNILIAAESVQGTIIAVDDDLRIDPGETKTLDVLANDINQTAGTMFVSQINGIDVVPGDSVDLITGETVTLTLDGELSIETNDTESEDTAFTYGISSTTGEFDVGFITLDTVPCFAAGTRIDTPDGNRPVQMLKVGDLVSTRDNGPQPIRWIGRRLTPATDRFAPITIAANTFGNHGRLTVSPLHRILISQARGELLFGSREVLVAARDLIDGGAVRQIHGGWVEYVHLLFDDHQIVWSEGLQTESFLPGPQTTSCFERDAVAEIKALFPDLDPTTGEGYGPAARTLLKPHEARLLAA